MSPSRMLQASGMVYALVNQIAGCYVTRVMWNIGFIQRLYFRCASWRVLMIGVALAAYIGVTLLPEVAWARAGGGGGFGGGDGGGGGGSGGGGGGGGGELIYWLVWLCIHYPYVGIPLVIGLLALFFSGGKFANERRITRTIRRGVQRQQQTLLSNGVATVQQHDPAFDTSQFLQRASTAFHKSQEAWSNQQIDSVRTFISDGIHERFSLQVQMQQTEGIRNQVEDVKIQNSDVVAVFTDGQFDTLHVRFHASAVDYDVSVESGRRVSGTKHADDFVEIWSFHRRPGAKTLAQPGAIEGQCPRCGSTLKIVDRAKCPACAAQVNSGEFDWVLAEITQEGEWSVPGNEQTVNGLAQMKQADPAFSMQHIEDRASVMFWRLRAAEFYRDLGQAQPILSPRYQDQYQRELEEMLQSNQFWKGPAVGRVEVIDVTPAADAEFDRVRVKVRWSGALQEGERGGSSRNVRSQAIYTDVFSLVRRRGVKSVAQAAFASAGCPACGAPIAVNQSGACTYCQMRITDGRHDWVLDDVSPCSADMAFLNEVTGGARPQPRTPQDSYAALVAPEDAELSLAVLARVMYSDGEVTPQEREALHRMGAHRKLPAEEVDLIIQSAQMAETKIPQPRDPVEAVQHLKQIVHMVMADGNISGKEQRLLKLYADQVGLAAADVQQAIKQERRRMYQDSRSVLRVAKTTAT